MHDSPKSLTLKETTSCAAFAAFRTTKATGNANVAGARFPRFLKAMFLVRDQSFLRPARASMIGECMLVLSRSTHLCTGMHYPGKMGSAQRSVLKHEAAALAAAKEKSHDHYSVPPTLRKGGQGTASRT